MKEFTSNIFFLIILCAAIAVADAKTLIASSPVFNDHTFEEFVWGEKLPKSEELAYTYNHMALETSGRKKLTGTFLGVTLFSCEYLMNDAYKFDSVRMLFSTQADWDLMRNKLTELLGDQYTGDLAGQETRYEWNISNIKVILRFTPWAKEHYSTSLEIINAQYYLDRGEPQTIQPENGFSERNPGNLNYDKIVDEKDLDVLIKSFGQCNKPGNYYYNSDADLDHDGCITENDKLLLKARFGEEGILVIPIPQ